MTAAVRRLALALGLTGLMACRASPGLAAPPSAGPHVEQTGGVVTYVAADGARVSVIGQAGADPALSPDTGTVAFIRNDDTEAGGSAVWLFDVRTHALRRLLASRPASEPKANLSDFSSPTFSPDGRRLYVMTAAWTTSSAVHSIDLVTGAERFVSAGNTLAVVRDGPYAGDLIASQHRYRRGGGAYDQLWLVRPDGRLRMAVPGARGDSEDPSGWLKQRHWRAW